MSVINEKFLVNTRGFTDLVDITQNVKSLVYNHNIKIRRRK